MGLYNCYFGSFFFEPASNFNCSYLFRVCRGNTHRDSGSMFSVSESDLCYGDFGRFYFHLRRACTMLILAQFFSCLLRSKIFF